MSFPVTQTQINCFADKYSLTKSKKHVNVFCECLDIQSSWMCLLLICMYSSSTLFKLASKSTPHSQSAQILLTNINVRLRLHIHFHHIFSHFPIYVTCFIFTPLNVSESTVKTIGFGRFQFQHNLRKSFIVVSCSKSCCVLDPRTLVIFFSVALLQ